MPQEKGWRCKHCGWNWSAQERQQFCTCPTAIANRKAHEDRQAQRAEQHAKDAAEKEAKEPAKDKSSRSSSRATSKGRKTDKATTWDP